MTIKQLQLTSRKKPPREVETAARFKDQVAFKADLDKIYKLLDKAQDVLIHARMQAEIKDITRHSSLIALGLDYDKVRKSLKETRTVYDNFLAQLAKLDS